MADQKSPTPVQKPKTLPFGDTIVKSPIKKK